MAQTEAMKQIRTRLEEKPADTIATLAKRNRRSVSAEIALAVDERIARELHDGKNSSKKI